MELKKFATAATFICLGASSLHAAGTAISGTTRTGSILTSISVGSETYSASLLAPGTSSDAGAYDGGFDVGVNNIALVDDLDLLHGASLSVSAGNGWTTTNFGGLGNYIDRNGDGYDFFVFERLGNDTLNARARYSIDGGDTFVLGDSVLIASANNSSQWGGSGYTNTVNPPPGTQQVFGTAFKVTDLVDDAGVALTNDVIISEIVFLSNSGIDPRAVLAAVPEPSSVGLLGIAVLGLAARRSRKQG